MKNKEQNRRSIKERVAEALEIPKELMLDAAKIVLIGNHDVTIENYKGILEYDEAVMRIKTTGRTVCVTGSGLEIRTITDEDIQVSGKIKSIDLQ